MFTTDLFGDTAAILNSTAPKSYYGLLRGQISIIIDHYNPHQDVLTRVAFHL